MNAFNSLLKRLQTSNASQQSGKHLIRPLVKIVSSVHGTNASSRKLQHLALAIRLDWQRHQWTSFVFSAKENEVTKM